MIESLEGIHRDKHEKGVDEKLYIPGRGSNSFCQKEG
jgi:hypothetical protein